MKRLFTILAACGLVFGLPAATRAQVPDECSNEADINHDGVVGSLDQTIIGTNFGAQCANIAAGNCAGDVKSTFGGGCHTCGDANLDGVVGASDLLLYGQQFLDEGCVYGKDNTLQNIPITGAATPAWNHLLAWADKALTTSAGTEFCDQESDDDQILHAKALAWIRMGGPDSPAQSTGGSNNYSRTTLRTQVLQELILVSTTDSEWRTGCGGNGDDLGVARNLAAYIVAAQVMDFAAASDSTACSGSCAEEEATFKDWVEQVAFLEGMGSTDRTLWNDTTPSSGTVQRRPNNFAGWGAASIMAAANYLGRWDVVDHPSAGTSYVDTESILRRHVGDQSAPIGSLNFNSDWQPEGGGGDGTNVSVVVRDPDNHGSVSQNTDWMDSSVFGCIGPRGYGLFPEERSQDNHPTFGQNVTYCSPWRVDNHEMGYWSGLNWSALVLQAQTGDVLWGVTTAMQDAKDRLDSSVWYKDSGAGPEYGSPESPTNHRYQGDDRQTACFVTIHSSSGEPASEDCCLNPGTGGDGVAKGFGFIGYLLPGISPHTDTCTP